MITGRLVIEPSPPIAACRTTPSLAVNDRFWVTRAAWAVPVASARTPRVASRTRRTPRERLGEAELAGTRGALSGTSEVQRRPLSHELHPRARGAGRRGVRSLRLLRRALRRAGDRASRR